MALIHQNLYSEDESLGGVRIDNYIKNLVFDLIQSYKIDNNRIGVDLSVSPIILDVDTVVPIGLIINELVSNSLKYAFPSEANGQINIELMEVDKKALSLRVDDNGIGYQVENIPAKSFGHRLIRAFAERLDAAYTFENNDGAKNTFIITNYKIAA